jgi:ubiquitin thioesterase OTU1
MEILSRLFEVEICVLHIEECRLAPVTAGKCKERIFLTYDNIHYNAVEFKGFGVPCVKKVPVDDEYAVTLAMDMVKILHAAGKFTNMKKAEIVCDTCGAVFRGQKEAQTHGNRTGHSHFSQRGK